MPDPVVFRRPVDGAAFLFSKGFKVFPIIANQKEPIVPEWQAWALEADFKRIEGTAKANPLLNWGVFASGSGLFILDVDTKKGRNGLNSLRELEQKHGALPPTFTVRTPTGGIHKYFRGEGKNTAGTIGEGLDTRGEGGYVVAPGSRIDDKTYEVIDDREVADAPLWLLEAANKRKDPLVLQEGALIEEGNRNAVLTSFAGTMRRRGMNYDAILAALEVVNEEQSEAPLAHAEIEHIARSICKYAPEQALVASDFINKDEAALRQMADIDPEKMPPRHWVMENRYMSGFLSVIISPGGVGKSMLTMLDGVAVATGRPLTGFHVPAPGPVWIYNTEDPMDELDRRALAISMHYGIPLPDVRDKVYISSGQDHPLIVAKDGQNGIVINQEGIEGMVKTIREKGIKLLIVDPFIRTHQCNENDNMQMDTVALCFQRIAIRTGCAVGLVHHTSKAGSKDAPGEMNAGRGATALVYASRIAHTINTMSDKEAKKFAIAHDRKRWYFRFDNAKANMQPPAERADWFERKSVILPNSDSVGTIERVDLKEHKKEKETQQEKAEAQDLANCLYELMKPGDFFPVDDVLTLILTSPKFKHLFEGYNPKYSREKLLNLLNKEQSLRVNSSEFTMDYDPSRRPKYKLKCSSFDVNLALLESLQ